MLAEHIKYGMFYEVFKWDAIKYDRAALVALCKSDNLDSAFALGETELQLLKAIKESLEVVRPAVGQTQWDVVLKLAMEQCAQRWTEEDVVSMYNFSKVIGETHLAFLTDTVAPHIDWDEQAVRPGDFHLAARVRAKLPWLKVALITAQYLPPEDKFEKGPFGKKFGNLVTKDQWERLGKASGGSDSPLGQVDVSCPTWLACI